MKLYLMRHGDAVSEHSDPNRPLSPKGKADVQKVAGFLKAANIKVNEVYHSTKLRTEETARIVQSAINPKAKLVRKDFLSPDDPIDKIVEDLTQRKDDLMLVGHLPQLPRIISRLVLGDENRFVISLDTSTIAAMYRDSQGHWQIVWIVGPSLLSAK